jgi:hypothetical protein
VHDRDLPGATRDLAVGDQLRDLATQRRVHRARRTRGPLHALIQVDDERRFRLR